MKRKKFIKKLMSVGIGRNAANWVCREGGRAGTILMARAMNLPGAYCVSGVFRTRDGLRLRVKVHKVE